MCTVQRWTAMSGHSDATAFSSRRAVDDDQLRRSNCAGRDRRAAHARPPRPSPPTPLITRASSPSARTPSATSNEIEVALLSSRTRATVPSRISRTIGSSASERAFQASQSPFVLRQTRLATPCRPARQTPRSTRVARGGCWSLRDKPRRSSRRGPGAAPAGAQRTLRHWRRLAVLAGRPSARHGDPRLAKRARQRPLAMPRRTPQPTRASSSPGLRRP